VDTRTRVAEPADADTRGGICYRAFAAVADRHGFPHDFLTVEQATAMLSGLITHPRIFGVVAEQRGAIVGSNFLDERSAISSVGPITVEPSRQHQGIGTRLMQAVLDEHTNRGAPGIRLVQAAYNTASMSLYTRLGFDVREQFALMQGSALNAVPPGFHVRAVVDADLKRCNELCFRAHGHNRDGELNDALDLGLARLVERDGRITGYSTGIGQFAHAVAETRDDLIALIGSVGAYSGTGFLVPMLDGDLLRWCLQNNLRLVYMANLMTMGLYQQPRGAYLASMGC
jgi:predicted N-acetyltransferase YhbS